MALWLIPVSRVAGGCGSFGRHRGGGRVAYRGEVPRLPRPSRNALLVAVLWAAYPVMVVIGWLVLDDSPGEAPMYRYVLEPVGGAVATAVLPWVLHVEPGPPDWQPDRRRERRAFWLGLVPVVLATFCATATLAALVAMVSLAGRRNLRWIVALLVPLCGLLAWGLLATRPEDLDGAPLWLVFLLTVLMVTVPILFGLYRGSRRALLRSLRQEAASVRAEQHAREEQARASERTRIAREMHDTLSHRLALVSLHAGALESRDDLDPEQVRTAAGVIRTGAEQAAQELAQVLAVLRAEVHDSAPAPTLESFPELVEQVRATGTVVDLDLDVQEPQSLPPAAAAHLYRVVQECLTNAVKHAPGRPVRVVVAGAPEAGARVTVSNPLPSGGTPGSGARVGLVGLQERLTLAGGTFRAGPQKGHFVVEASVPWQK